MSSLMPLFLDCDPGIDDALALAYLCCRNEVDVIGIAASGGNVATEQVAANARGWLELAGRSDIPVHAGHSLPLAWQEVNETSGAGGPEYADLTHGSSGTGYAQLPAPAVPLSPVSAAQAWVDAAHAQPGELIGVVIGPLTNLALALAIEPELPNLCKGLFIMGGAFNYRGNTHPTTEWNVTFDPEAAARVLAAFGAAHEAGTLDNLPVIAPIEATEAVEMTPDGFAAILDGAVETDQRWQAMLDQLSEALRFYFEFHESDGLGHLAHIHDPFVLACALEWARKGDAVAVATNEHRGDLPWAKTVRAPVDVELTGTLTRGETVADWLGRWGRSANAEIIRSIDSSAFLDHLSTTLMAGPPDTHDPARVSSGR